MGNVFGLFLSEFRGFLQLWLLGMNLSFGWLGLFLVLLRVFGFSGLRM